jgi:hypothetical protein
MWAILIGWLVFIPPVIPYHTVVRLAYKNELHVCTISLCVEEKLLELPPNDQHENTKFKRMAE